MITPSSGGQDILHLSWKQQKALLDVIIIKYFSDIRVLNTEIWEYY